MSPPLKRATLLHSQLFLNEKIQAKILREDRFVAVFGIEAVDSWVFDWSILVDSVVTITDPRRISVMSNLHTKLQNMTRKRHDADSELENLRSDFLILRDNRAIAHMDILETIV